MIGTRKDSIAATEVRSELEVLLKSEQFARSERQTAFLKYLCEQWLKGKTDRLNEYQIAIEVFNRRADYSAAEDSTVRVQAHELRRRLREYYLGEGKDRLIRLEIPKGSYRPSFTRVAPALEAATPPAMVSSLWRVVEQRLYLLLALVALSMGLNVWFVASHSRSSSTSGHNGVFAKEYSSYAELFGRTHGRSDALICLSNPRVFLLYGGHTAPPASFLAAQTVPLTPEMQKTLEQAYGGPPAALPNVFLHPTSDEYTGMGEAASAYRLGQLMDRLDVPVRLTQARFLNWDQALGQNLIVLGLPHATPWTRENLSSRFFQETDDGILLLNTTDPQSRYDVAYDSNTGQIMTDYGVISRETTSTGSSTVILAGSSSFGTFGTGEFFCNPEKMNPVFEKLKSLNGGKELPRSFLVLLKIKVRENIPVDTSFVLSLVDPSGNRPVKPVSVQDSTASTMLQRKNP